MLPKRSYVICASPRSGSSLLSEALAATGIAGKPMEYFNPGLTDEIIRARQLGIEREELYVQAFLYASTTENGVFGTKLHAFQTPTLLSRFSQHTGSSFSSLRTALETVLPELHYIYITRGDIEAQAVSYYRSLMTGEWWRWQGREAPPSDASVPFDYFGIEKCRLLLDASNAYWEGFFAAHAIRPLRVTYEQLASGYVREVTRTLEFLDLYERGVKIEAPSLQRMRDARSQAWKEKYRELRAKRGAVSLGRPSWAPY